MTAFPYPSFFSFSTRTQVNFVSKADCLMAKKPWFHGASVWPVSDTTCLWQRVWGWCSMHHVRMVCLCKTITKFFLLLYFFFFKNGDCTLCTTCVHLSSFAACKVILETMIWVKQNMTLNDCQVCICALRVHVCISSNKRRHCNSFVSKGSSSQKWLICHCH